MSYSSIGLYNPKDHHNIGSVLRACVNFNVSMLAVEGGRYNKQAGTNTLQGHHEMPFLNNVDNLHDVIPYDCVPVAIDLVEGATNIVEYKHPDRAFYIFGPEDGTLGRKVTDYCRDVVYVPTVSCMNLAATVHVVMYDRMLKEAIKGS